MATTTLYNPATLSEEDLVSNFVVRTRIFDQIFRDIKEGDMRYPEKHYLIQGARGMGKTMLLLRLKYEIERSVELNDWLIPLFFSEEAYDVSSLSGLWEKILKYLDEHFETGGAYYAYTEKFLNLEDYEKRCFDYLIEVLREREKKLLVLYDNFGTLFLDNLREKEKRRLREILIECNDIRIIGSSAVVIHDLHDYNQPFFEFFKIIYLEGLNREESYALLTKIQENHEESKHLNLNKCEAKIDALTVLSEGVVRTIVIIYQVLLEDQSRSILQDLQRILDRITPLYKHRVEDLPVQQRRIVDVLAKKWDAVSAKEIAGEIREDGKIMSTKQISAQLNQLEKSNVVEKKATTTKNNLYQLRERFFNIWYLMRNGDTSDKKRIVWLIEFLEIWYGNKMGVTVPVVNPLNILGTGKALPASVFLTAEAFVKNLGKIKPTKYNSLKGDSSALFRESDKNYLPTISYRKLVIAYRYFQKKDVAGAIKIIKSIKHPNRSCHLFLTYLYLASGEKIDASKELSKVMHVQAVEFDFFVNLCIELDAYDWIEKEVMRNQNISQGQQEKAFAEVCLSRKEYDAARLHCRNALREGVEVFEGYIASVRGEGDEDHVEKTLTHEYKNGDIPASYLLAYLLITRKISKRTIEEVYPILSSMKKDADYYFFYGLTLTHEDYIGKSVVGEIIQSFRRSRELYEQKGEQGTKYLLATTLLLTFYIRERDRKKALELTAEIKMKSLGNLPTTVVPCLLVDLWNNDFSTVQERMDTIIKLELGQHEDRNLINLGDILILLLAKKQYYTVLKIFNTYAILSDVLKPVYYALMTFLKDEYPNEIIRMGKELRHSVEKILIRVNQQEVDYQ